VTFSAAQGVLWKSALPGKGCSTPVVWGERIVLTAGAGEGTNGLDCVIGFEWATGKKMWQTELGRQRPGRHRRGSGSNPSPVTDGTRVYVYFKSGTLAALDFTGAVLWQTNLQQRYGKDTLWWDLGTSPVLAGGRLVVAVMQEENSYVVALDPATGRELWKKVREYPGREETRQSYTTPLVVRAEGRDELVLWGADHLTGHDAATGDLLWQCGGFNPENKPVWRVIASRRWRKASPSSRTARAVRGGHQDWRQRRYHGRRASVGETRTGHRRRVAARLRRQGCFVNFKGKMWCLDLETGNERWTALLPRAKGSSTAHRCWRATRSTCAAKRAMSMSAA
jgi:outer membrane protein assembly factor BamB